MKMKMKWLITLMLAVGALGTFAQTTTFTNPGGDIYTEANWDNGFPVDGTNGTLAVDAVWTNTTGQHMDGWDLVQTAGTLEDLASGYGRNEIRGGTTYEIQTGASYVRTNSTQRLHGGATLTLSGGSAHIKGIAATSGQSGGFTLNVSAGSFVSEGSVNFNNAANPSTIAVSGGTAEFGVVDSHENSIDEANTFYNVDGGTLTLYDLSFSGSTGDTNNVATVSGDGQLTTHIFDRNNNADNQPDCYITLNSTNGTWTWTGATTNDFVTKWQNAVLRNNSIGGVGKTEAEFFDFFTMPDTNTVRAISLALPETTFVNANSNIMDGANWDNGLPAAGVKGTLALDAVRTPSAHMDGWYLIQTAGTVVDEATSYVHSDIRGGTFYEIQGGAFVRTNSGSSIRIQGESTLKISGGSATFRELNSFRNGSPGMHIEVTAGSLESYGLINCNKYSSPQTVTSPGPETRVTVSGGTASIGMGGGSKKIDERDVVYDVSGGSLSLYEFVVNSGSAAYKSNTIENVNATVSGSGQLYIGAGGFDMATTNGLEVGRYISVVGADASLTIEGATEDDFIGYWTNNTLLAGTTGGRDLGAEAFGLYFSVTDDTVVQAPQIVHNGSFDEPASTEDTLDNDMVEWITGTNSAAGIQIDRVRRRSNIVADGTHALCITYNEGLTNGAIQNTGYVVSEGESFDFAFQWKNAYIWDNADAVTWRLFVTSDDTLSGTVTDLASGSVNGNDSNWQQVVTNGVGLVGAGSAGRELWIEFSGTMGPDEWARLDNVRLVASVPDSGYGGWISGYGLSGSPDADMDYDYDGDGLDNLSEYGLGGNPDDVNDTGYPVAAFAAEVDSTNYFVYVHPQRTTADSGLTYDLEQTTDMIITPWTNEFDHIVLPDTGYISDNFESVTNLVPSDLEGQQFIQLKISAE